MTDGDDRRYRHPCSTGHRRHQGHGHLRRGGPRSQFQKGRWNWYAQGALHGPRGGGRPDVDPDLHRLGLKDSGSGNQVNFLTGLA